MSTEGEASTPDRIGNKGRDVSGGDRVPRWPWHSAQTLSDDGARAYSSSLQPYIQKKPTRGTPGSCQTYFEILKLCSDWQDPEFMKDVEAATGVDLGSSKYSKKGKGKKKKHPNLTDLRERANTARARLEKKVFAKGAVQRVVAAMNQMDQKKHEKFANQFNYALK